MLPRPTPRRLPISTRGGAGRWSRQAVRPRGAPGRRPASSTSPPPRDASRCGRSRPPAPRCWSPSPSAPTSTAFAIARGVLWRPLPYPAADRLVTLWQFDKGETVQISYPDFADLRRNGSLDAGAALSAGVGTLVTGEPGVADRVQEVEAEPALFAMLGATPALGRLLTADDGGKPFAMISHRLWQSRFGADAAVVGRSFTLSGRAYTIVGVLPAGFDLELPVSAGFTLDHADIWTSFDSTFPFVTRRDVSGYEAIARLAPGVTLDLAQRRADATAAVLQRDFAATNKTRAFRLIPLRDRLVERARQPLVLAGLGALTVALIALANLTTLALGRLGDAADRARRAPLARRLVVAHHAPARDRRSADRDRRRYRGNRLGGGARARAHLVADRARPPAGRDCDRSAGRAVRRRAVGRAVARPGARRASSARAPPPVAPRRRARRGPSRQAGATRARRRRGRPGAGARDRGRAAVARARAPCRGRSRLLDTWHADAPRLGVRQPISDA